MLRNLFLLAFLAASAFAIIPNHYHFREHFNPVSRVRGNDAISVVSGFMNQNLDHFTPAAGNFTQRYFYTQQYTLHQKTAFLYVANRGDDFEEKVITDERNPIVKTAKEFGATVFSLEHRYYGKSKPNVDKFDANNLRFLTSFQAIQDIISFIKYANVEFNMDPDVRWVLWGVGYGGVIAAEARKLDPITVSGVIASSSPLTHEYDFWQFNDEVSVIINQMGGYLCAQKVTQGFADIRAAMRTPEGRSNVSDLFHLNPRLDQTNLTYNDIQMFYLAAIAPFQQIVQFNNDFNISIGDMCTTIDKSNWSNMEVIYQAYVYLSTVVFGKVEPMIVSYQTIVNDLGNQSVDSPFLEARMWQYLACTEFGWFFTTNNNEQGMFGAVVPTSLFLNQCFDIFPDAKLSATFIRDSVINTNNFYGASDDYSGTNAVFTNGLYDPWSRLGKESTGDFSVVAYIIPLASFASDMFPGDTTNVFIRQAHALMSENINRWVNGPRNPKTYVNTTNPWTRPYWGEFASLRETQGKLDIESRFSKLGDDVPSKKKYPQQKFKKMFLGRPPHGFLPEPDFDLDAANYPAGYEVGMFKQREDHFNNGNPGYFQQKFFKNAQWAKPGGPNFLLIGGEGPQSEKWVLNENIPYLTWAKKYGATVWCLEHRFYGDSRVGIDNTDLTKLNSLQMLYDLAEFIKGVNYKTGTNNPWITIGGSYSGVLSAWMREVFPDLVVGAVASSAPVFVKTDFYEYLMVAENSIRTYNPTCADRIKSGFDTMRQLFLTKEGRKNLSDLFQLDPPFGENVTDTDQHYFFSNVYSNFQIDVQYSEDNLGLYANGHGIPDMCNIMTNDTNTPLYNIAAFNRFMTIANNGGGPYIGMDNSYQDMVAYLQNAQNVSAGMSPNDAAALLWTWQSCSEFGWFQSADSGNGIFGSPVPLNMFVQLCMDVFNEFYQRSAIDRLVDYTNYKYGERYHYRGTNVVMANGDVDPWHALGLYYPNDKSVVPYLINGTAHCADMYPPRDSDPPGLKIARDLIDANIAIWLNQAPAPTGTTGTPGTGPTDTPGTGGTGSTATIQTTTKSASTSTVILSFIAIFARYLL